MNIPYRTRLKLQRSGTAALFVLMVLLLVWFCWILWLERYVIYTRDGATIDFSLSSQKLSGVVATPQKSSTDIGIYYNEGEYAISTSTDLEQINGYYVTVSDLVNDFAAVKEQLTALPTGTPIMLEVKNKYGTFYYPSEVSYAQSEAVDVSKVAELVEELKMRGMYMIARLPAFCDYLYGVNNTTSGLPLATGRFQGALWMDPSGYYWLKPTDAGTLNYLTTLILELKTLGFDEVVLSEFWMPASNDYAYNGDPIGDVVSAASSLMTSLSTDYFTVSFMVSDSTFALPEGRSRMYLENVTPSNVSLSAAQATISEADIRLVFLADTNDTRYDAYGVLRPLESPDSAG